MSTFKLNIEPMRGIILVCCCEVTRHALRYRTRRVNPKRKEPAKEDSHGRFTKKFSRQG
jgi:hypothetical protein